MPANVYECMFLLDTTKVAGDVPAAAKQLHALLERNQAEILVSRPWHEQRLAYPIKNHKKGLYYLTYFRAEGKVVQSLERDLALSELVLRYLILHVDPKLVETMLAVARDEHALHLRTVSEPAEGEGEGEAAPAEGAPAHEGRGGERREGGGPPPRRGGARKPVEAAKEEE
jgi:small subunit ribosomal protein S6